MNSKKRCKFCKEYFDSSSVVKAPAGTFCTYDHAAKWAIEKVKAERIKTDRRQHRERKESIKTKADYIRDLSVVFNKFIRLRDANEPCISCKRHHTGQYHAGHYRSRGAHKNLQFEELNVHKQCQPCNTHLSGNLVDYRINLIKKIGLAKVEWLEGPHEPKHYTIEEIKNLITQYKQKLKEAKTNG